MVTGVNFHFRALGYFKLGTPLEGLRRQTLCKSALHVPATFTEQVVPIHKHIPLKMLFSLLRML